MAICCYGNFPFSRAYITVRLKCPLKLSLYLSWYIVVVVQCCCLLIVLIPFATRYVILQHNKQKHITPFCILHVGYKEGLLPPVHFFCILLYRYVIIRWEADLRYTVHFACVVVMYDVCNAMYIHAVILWSYVEQMLYISVRLISELTETDPESSSKNSRQ